MSYGFFDTSEEDDPGQDLAFDTAPLTSKDSNEVIARNNESFSQNNNTSIFGMPSGTENSVLKSTETSYSPTRSNCDFNVYPTKEDNESSELDFLNDTNFEGFMTPEPEEEENGFSHDDYDHNEDDSGDETDMEQEGIERYDFRTAARAKEPILSGAYLDRDETGDYDPAAERKELLKAMKRRKRIPQAKCKDSSEGDALDKTELGDESALDKNLVTENEQQVQYANKNNEEHQEDNDTIVPSSEWKQTNNARSQNSCSKISKICTKLFHPVFFNHRDPTGKKACNWCSDPPYGLIGVGEDRTVEVIEWHHGRFCTELPSTDNMMEAQQSRCCVKCTTKRLYITICEQHVMQPISSQIHDKEAMDWQKAFSQLLDSAPGAKSEALLNRFCSVCPALATFECAASSLENASSVDSRDRPLPCTLRLCRVCEETFRRQFSNDLQKMLAEVVVHPSRWPLGLRADSSFLRTDSYMVQQISDDSYEP